MGETSVSGGGSTYEEGSRVSSRHLILVTGGARSGKSRYAEALAARIARGRHVVYVATATPGDDEMRARIAEHRARRPPSWRTIEEPSDPGAAIRAAGASHFPAVVLVDCLTLLVSNALLGDVETPAAGGDVHLDTRAEHHADAAIASLLGAYRAGSASFVVVTNEVGMGLVPAVPLGRHYRDVLGRLNSRIASEADAVVLVLAGIPVELKTLAAAWTNHLDDWLGPDDGSA